MRDRLGFQRAVVVQPSVYGADNSRLLAAIDELGRDRARGVAMLAGSVEAEELARLDRGGVKAARFITTAGGGPSLSELPQVARAIAPLGWHIEAYVVPEMMAQLLSFAADLPVPIVFDHLGGLAADTRADDATLAAILSLLDAGFAWVKLTGYRNSLAGPPFSDLRPLVRRFVEHAPERCVWGTDWPHTNVAKAPDDRTLLDLMFDWVPEVELRQLILVENPGRLYGF
jgi:predicted TIM-barrel fold metal-dependent hydrolase